MPNSHYYRARAAWAQGQLNWVADDIRALLVGSGYVADLANDEFLASIVAGNRLGTAVALAGKAVSTDGRCTASSPVIFDPVPSTGTLIGLVLYRHTGSDATARLLVYMDEAVSGLPLTMSGAPVHITLPAAGIILL